MMSSNVNEDIEKEEDFTNDQLNEYTNLEFGQYIRAGSSAEQLYIPFPNHAKSDIDLMFEFPYIYVVDPEQCTAIERQEYDNNRERRFLYIDYSNKNYPCYLKLYFHSTRNLVETSEKTAASILLPDTNVFLTPSEYVDPHRKFFPSSNLVHWFKNKWPANEIYDEKLEVHGPSICKISRDPNLPVPTDHVPAMKCLHWPKPAMNWIYRTRSSNWPNHNLINSVTKFGCHIVPVSHILSNNETKDIEWRFSFSVCEILIARSLGFYQKKCYLIVKALIDVHIKQDIELSKLMCSYYLKTSLYWLCESLEKERWTYETLYDRFVDFIDYIINCFKNKCLKHYFIPEMNLIDHLDDEMSKKVSEKCALIKNDWLNMIRLCEEHYWNTNQFLRFSPIIEVLTTNDDIVDYSCIIWCCAYTMQAFIKQHKLIDRPLKMVNDCLRRNYLESCSKESAQFLLYVTNLIVQILQDENVYSMENLSAHNAMIKICEIKGFDDQPYEIMKSNYEEIHNNIVNTNK